MLRIFYMFLLIISFNVYGNSDDWLVREIDNNEMVYTTTTPTDLSNPIIVFGERNIPDHVTDDMRTFLKEHGGSSEYQFLSNFYAISITVDGRVYASSEHYYQAAKFELDSPIYNEIVNAPSPALAKKIAWDHAKEAIIGDDQLMCERMKKALLAKFANEDGTPTCLGIKLLATGDRLIIEGNYRISAEGKNMSDRRWGAELDLTSPDYIKMYGKNLLGKLLMELRQNLQETTFTQTH